MSSDDDLPMLKHHSPPRTLSRRKRSRVASCDSNSSDAALFSSDDLADASADNYAEPRRKKHFARTWWEPEEDTSSRSYRDARREMRAKAVDSGVFLSSDASSADDGFSLEPMSTDDLDFNAVRSAASPKNRVDSKAVSTPFTVNGVDSVSPTLPKRFRKPGSFSSSQPEDSLRLSRDTLVERAVNRCLDESDEVLDLSHSGLESLPTHHMTALKQLVREPRGAWIPHQQAYHSLNPKLQVYATHNKMHTFPLGLCQLDHLHALSLRYNNIRDIPPSVNNLLNLTELNMAANQLRWLPWNLLDLLDTQGSLVTLNIFANPLVKPFADDAEFKLPSLVTPQLDSLRAVQSKIDTLQPFLHDLQQSSEPLSTNRSTQVSWLLRILKIVRQRLQATQSARTTPDRRILNNKQEEAHVQRPAIYLASTAISYFDVKGLGCDGSPTAVSRSPNATIMPCVASPYTPRCPKHRSCVEHANCTTSPCIAASPQSRCVPKGTCDSPACANQPRVKSLVELAMRAVLADRAYEYDLPAHLGDLYDGARAEDRAGDKTCSTCQRTFVIPRAEWIEYWHPLPKPELASLDGLAVPFLRRACSWACARPTSVDVLE